jgi:tetratricopeptide (TPR) repeat protein
MLKPHRLRARAFLGPLVGGLLLLSPAVSAEEPSAARARIKAATYQFRAQRFERAIELAREALEAAGTPEERQDALNLVGLGLHAQAKGDPAKLGEAETVLRQALAQTGTRNPTTCYNLAVVLRDAGEAEEALELAREVVGTAEGTQLADKARILACQAKRKLPEAEPVPEPKKLKAQTQGQPLELDEVGPPIRIYDPRPKNPGGHTGIMIVQAVIDKDGCVAHTKTLTSRVPDDLTRATRGMLATWVFRPARLRGEPMEVYYNLTVTFSAGKKGKKGRKKKPKSRSSHPEVEHLAAASGAHHAVGR